MTRSARASLIAVAALTTSAITCPAVASDAEADVDTSPDPSAPEHAAAADLQPPAPSWDTSVDDVPELSEDAPAPLPYLVPITPSFQLAQYQGGYQQGYGPQPYQPLPPKKKTPKSSGLEMAYLYGTAVAYGVGTGIWIDAEFEIEDPGLRFIAPGILGIAAPVGVFILDNPPMPEGMPSAIATGLVVGAGEGLGVATYQYVTADEPNEWGFKGLARSEVIGATVGGAAGALGWYFFRPTPKTNMFITSSIFWGTAIGDFFGGGASNGDWGEANDDVGLGGLIGYNVALAGAVGLSTVWTPSWDQLGWMWGGLALGSAVSLPVYIFYAGSDADPRRGLIFQGVAATLGLAAGAFIGRPDKKGAIVDNETEERPSFATVTGGSFMPVPNGVGAQVNGVLW